MPSIQKEFEELIDYINVLYKKYISIGYKIFHTLVDYVKVLYRKYINVHRKTITIVTLCLIVMVSISAYTQRLVMQDRTQKFITLSKEYLKNHDANGIKTLIAQADPGQYSPEFRNYLQKLLWCTTDSKLNEFFERMSLENYELLKQRKFDTLLKPGQMDTSFINDPELARFFLEQLAANTPIMEEILLKRKIADKLKKIIDKYAQPFIIVNSIPIGPVKANSAPDGYLDIDIESASAQTVKERAATVLAAYEKYRKYTSRGIEWLHLSPCSDDKVCQEAFIHEHAFIAEVGYSGDELTVSASDMKIKPIDILLLKIKYLLSVNDPYWQDYLAEGIEYDVIYDTAVRENPYLTKTITPDDVRNNHLMGEGVYIPVVFSINANGNVGLIWDGDSNLKTNIFGDL